MLNDLYGVVNKMVPPPRKTIPFRILADEDWVVVEARGNAATNEGVRYDNHYCLLYRFEGGMIKEIREYNDSILCERVLGKYPVDRLPA